MRALTSLLLIVALTGSSVGAALCPMGTVGTVGAAVDAVGTVAGSRTGGGAHEGHVSTKHMGRQRHEAHEAQTSAEPLDHGPTSGPDDSSAPRPPACRLAVMCASAALSSRGTAPVLRPPALASASPRALVAVPTAHDPTRDPPPPRLPV